MRCERWCSRRLTPTLSKGGNTVRLGWKDATLDTVFIYFNCRTDLVGRFRATFGDEFACEGNRAVASMSLDREREDPSDVDLVYSYDPAGNPVKIADTGAQAGAGDVQCFTYDHRRRVVGAWSQASTECAADAASATIGGPALYGHTYGYDDAGNRTTLVDQVSGVTTSYDYPAAGAAGPHTLSSLSTSDGQSVDYTYDDAGNTLTADSSVAGDDQVYEWNPHGRMDTAATETGTSEFVYDADGSRLLRRTSETTTLYVHGDEITLDHSTNGVSGHRYYTFGGQTLAMRDSGSDELHTLAADLWGTQTVAFDNYTSAITTRRFDPFGAPRDAQPVTGWPGDRGWHTGTHDDATGLIHMGARQYQPQTGRFLSVDPLMDPFDPDQVHGYAYANNNPMAFSDPSGLWFTSQDEIVAQVDSLLGADDGGGKWFGETTSSVGSALSSAANSAGTSLKDFGVGAADAGADTWNGLDQVGECMLLDKNGACGKIGDGVAATWNDPSLLAEPYASRWKEGNYSGAIGYGVLGLFEVLVGSKGIGAAASTPGRVTPSVGDNAANNVANGVRFRAQLTGQEISGGHAFQKHVIDRAEFPGITTRSQFAQHIEDVVTNGVMRPLERGRSAYWRDGAVVIRDPNHVDGGTAFRPTDGYDYFLGLD